MTQPSLSLITRELVPEDRHLRPHEPGEQPDEEGLGCPVGGVGAIHRRGMHLHKQFFDRGPRLVDLGDPNHFGSAVPGVVRGLVRLDGQSVAENSRSRWAQFPSARAQS